jgi:hypothetical protein
VRPGLGEARRGRAAARLEDGDEPRVGPVWQREGRGAREAALMGLAGPKWPADRLGFHVFFSFFPLSIFPKNINIFLNISENS